ncbi:hypothetical protein WA158_005359 [Blastocystis sp. Blastoise]
MKPCLSELDVCEYRQEFIPGFPSSSSLRESPSSIMSLRVSGTNDSLSYQPSSLSICTSCDTIPYSVLSPTNSSPMKHSSFFLPNQSPFSILEKLDVTPNYMCSLFIKHDPEETGFISLVDILEICKFAGIKVNKDELYSIYITSEGVPYLKVFRMYKQYKDIRRNLKQKRALYQHKKVYNERHSVNFPLTINSEDIEHSILHILQSTNHDSLENFFNNMYPQNGLLSFLQIYEYISVASYFPYSFEEMKAALEPYSISHEEAFTLSEFISYVENTSNQVGDPQYIVDMFKDDFGGTSTYIPLSKSCQTTTNKLDNCHSVSCIKRSVTVSTNLCSLPLYQQALKDNDLSTDEDEAVSF